MDKQLQNDISIVESLLIDCELSDRLSFQNIKERIAELEKDALRYCFIRDQFSPVSVLIDGIDCGIANEEMDLEIDSKMATTPFA